MNSLAEGKKEAELMKQRIESMGKTLGLSCLYYAKFSLGKIRVTKSVLSVFTVDEINKFLGNHATCDWGNLSPFDKKQNENALISGGRLFSRYNKQGKVAYVITEADRSITTVMLPEDY